MREYVRINRIACPPGGISAGGSDPYPRAAPPPRAPAAVRGRPVHAAYRDTFRIKIYRSWEYLYFKFVWRSRRVPGVGCFRFRGFAPVGGPDCGGVRPYMATPWVTLLVYPTMCG